MALVATLDFDPVVDLITRAIKRNDIALGSSKKAQEIASARTQAYIEGLGEALELFATERRFRRVQRLLEDKASKTDWHSMAEGVVRWLFKLRTRWADGEFKDVSDDVFFRQMLDEFENEFVWPDWIAEEYMRQRKSLVLRGELPPAEDDRPWLQEELAKSKQTWQELQDLMEGK